MSTLQHPSSPPAAAAPVSRGAPAASAGSVLVAVPLAANGDLSPHFGASAQVGLFTLDGNPRRIIRATAVRPPLPEPCGWADWLRLRGVRVFLAGGMGRGAQERMAGAGIEVITGVPADLPALLVQAWANGTLRAGPNGCDGSHGHHHHHDHGGHAGEHGCCGE